MQQNLVRRCGMVTLMCTALFNGCATPPSQEQAGMVIGGVLGGVIGSQVGGGSGRTAAVILGTLAGVSVGGALGRTMDDADRLKTAHALENVRSGVPSQWRNPDSGHEYRVTPLRTYQSEQGPCREYTVEGQISGQRQQVTGNACRQADGSWHVVP
jgi:surface antigen